MELKSTQIKEITDDPIKAAEAVHLIYVTEDKLTIQRRGRGRGFIYLKNGKKIEDEKALKRFKKLVIPPAWKEVRISPFSNSHLQAVGKDIKERIQYRYHPQWEKIRNATKFFKMEAFGKVLPKIREQVAKDLKQTTMTKDKCTALIICLMEETHMRIGNEQYAKENQTYGLSTLRNKHLDTNRDEMLFNFTGKKGKKHSIHLENKKLKKLVMQCKEIPGWELFQYYDDQGQHHTIDSGMVNDYIQRISGDSFSAKDFRTWAASKIFLETLIEIGQPENKTQMKNNLIAACDAAAEELGNTRSVCRSYYVHPAIIEKYENGSINKMLNKKNKTTQPYGLTPVEKSMLEIISDYDLKIDDSLLK